METPYQHNDHRMLAAIRRFRDAFATMAGDARASPDNNRQTEKEEPHPQVVAALGLLTTKRDPISTFS